MLTLNINKLRNEVEERENKKNKIFETILDLCYQKILNMNKQNNDYNCTFIVPNVVFGLPLYNVGDCVVFIMDKLVEKGFEIYFAPPTTIHISWKPKEQNHNNYLNIQSNNQLDYYNTLNQQHKLMIKYNSSNNNSNHNNNNNNHNNNNLNNNIQSKKNNQKNIQYKPIDDYKQLSNSIYDSDDLDLFQNKIDNLF
jgi:hypothetical protein